MDVRGRLLERLATPRTDRRFGEPYFPRQSIDQLGCRSYEFWEAIWGLVADGLVYLDPAGQEHATSWDNWRWQLSQRGIQAATGGSWEPRDPERYLERLTTRCPDLDDAAFAYVGEALQAFNARCYLASSVMLGVAAEQVFNRLAGAFAAASESASLSKLLGNPSTTYFKRFQEFRKRLEPRRANLPDGLADNLTLDAVADLLRITRNNAGHPTGRSVDEDTAYTHLQMAARFLTKMTELAVYFEENGEQAGRADRSRT